MKKEQTVMCLEAMLAFEHEMLKGCRKMGDPDFNPTDYESWANGIAGHENNIEALQSAIEHLTDSVPKN